MALWVRYVRPRRSFHQAIIEPWSFQSSHTTTLASTTSVSEPGMVGLIDLRLESAEYHSFLRVHSTIIWGCMTFNTCSGEWLQLQWPDSWQRVNIAIKNMVPIVLSGLSIGSTSCLITWQLWQPYHLIWLTIPTYLICWDASSGRPVSVVTTQQAILQALLIGQLTQSTNLLQTCVP